jgi:uncharacterized protein (TIGR03435 family)
MRSSNLARTLLLMVTATSAMAPPIAVGALQATPRVQQPQTAPRLAFEVASIKPSGPNSPPTSRNSSPGRFTTSATSLRRLVTWAYDVGDDRLVGAPEWLDSSRFDISAKVPQKEQDEEPVRERLKVMMQSLLADCFRLVSHRETRGLPIYALLVDRSGPKIQLRDAGNDLARNTFSMPGSGHLVGAKVTDWKRAGVLSRFLSSTGSNERRQRTDLHHHNSPGENERRDAKRRAAHHADDDDDVPDRAMVVEPRKIERVQTVIHPSAHPLA